MFLNISVSKLNSGALKQFSDTAIYHACRKSWFSHLSRQTDSGQLSTRALSASCNDSYRPLLSSFCISKCLSLKDQKFSTSNPKGRSRGGGNKMLDDSFDTTELEEVRNLITNAWTVGMGHQVLVVQPYIKWGPEKKTNTSPELMLEEAVALVKSLSTWKVVNAVKIGLERISKDMVFGSGNVSSLARTVASNSSITAVFISIDKLTNEQYFFLSNLFDKPVFDRYSLVIQIFKEHARTPEAKLQVAMAEIPYVTNHLSPHYDKSKKILMKYQKKMETSLAKLRKHRGVARKNRQALEYPVIALVGYTNAGKTSLIKALTEEESITPRNVLFATLDVTMHEARLPCQVKVLYADTIGFISDLPIQLIEPLTATLEDAMLADVIIHVMDVSHPNYPAQYDEVINTLEKLNLDPNLFESMITVGNKVDLITHEQSLDVPSNVLLVSAVKNIGLNQLKAQLETRILSSTNRRRITVRVKTGSAEEAWLRDETAILSMDVDPNNSLYSLLKIIITPRKLDLFRHQFIKSNKNK